MPTSGNRRGRCGEHHELAAVAGVEVSIDPVGDERPFQKESLAPVSERASI